MARHWTVPKNRQPGDVESEGSGFFNQVADEDVTQARAQKDKRQAAEVTMLDQPGITLREYRRRRKATLVSEPSIPCDEMSYQDYKAARSRGCTEKFDDEGDGEPLVFNY